MSHCKDCGEYLHDDNCPDCEDSDQCYWCMVLEARKFAERLYLFINDNVVYGDWDACEGYNDIYLKQKEVNEIKKFPWRVEE